MYLTHMPLNPQRRSTRDLVASAQRLHAAVLSCFVPGTDSVGRVLWRLDRPEPHRLDLYVVSPSPPSMEALVDQAGWPAQPVWRTADYASFLAKLEDGQKWVFRLRANPIKSLRSVPGKRGNRVPLVRTADQLEWLAARGDRSGFRISAGEHGPNVRVTEQVTNRFARHSDGQQRTVTLATAAFEGVLEVTDTQALRSVLTTGIGAGKGYGCGLMTLAPVR
ncbi:type I-E CRISPR-associated protein Cas6/Cse3/CasE [Tessaracoccus caeni]|uniref:type I-E CRISPR-associated protein Cas6/Cse3/CasE n=1 Tax=Tessaracoccus caeni TaxID=3031239 RepID=UPI003872BBD5